MFCVWAHLFKGSRTGNDVLAECTQLPANTPVWQKNKKQKKKTVAAMEKKGPLIHNKQSDQSALYNSMSDLRTFRLNICFFMCDLSRQSSGKFRPRES